MIILQISDLESGRESLELEFSKNTMHIESIQLPTVLIY